MLGHGCDSTAQNQDAQTVATQNQDSQTAATQNQDAHTAATEHSSTISCAQGPEQAKAKGLFREEHRGPR